MKTVKIEGYNNFEIVGYLWDKVEKPVGVLQIIHGMQEHALRYASFAKYLNSLGIIVFASDLRGHGQTALLHNLPLGYSDGDIFMEIVNDQIIVTEYLSKKFELPISVLGHSFGSFVTQRYMVENGFKVKNVILSGSSFSNSMAFRAGYRVAQIQRAFGLKKKRAKMIEKMAFGSYGKKFKNGNWLSRDEKVWEMYKQDELCGKPFPVNFYYSFFKNARNNYKNLNNIPYYLPILIVSGTEDPVSGKDGIPKLFFEYAKARKRLFLKNYVGARHEILNETNKDEVYKDISDFILNDKIDSTAVKYENQ